MTEEEETVFLAEAYRFLSTISYGEPGHIGIYSEVVHENLIKPRSISKDAKSRILRSTEWLSEETFSTYTFRKRTHPGYNVSFLGYIPPSIRKSLMVPVNNYLDTLLKPTPGKVQSYRHLLPGIKDQPSSTLTETRDESVEEDENDHYDPESLDNPELRSGKHRTVISLTSYLAEFLKKEINEKFRKLHPNVHPSLTLSQIRNLKLLLLQIAINEGLELASVARSYAYLEKLVLARVVNKTNRKILGGCCLLLAAKATDSKQTDYRKLLDASSSSLLVSSKELVDFEFPIFAKLRFKLQIGEDQFGCHLNRILTWLDYSNLQEYLGERMYQLWKWQSSSHLNKQASYKQFP